jgi:hypothetical protein
MFDGIIFFSENNEIERAFYKRLNELCGCKLRLVEAKEIVPLVISSAFDRKGRYATKPVALIAVDYGEQHGLRVHPEVHRINKIEIIKYNLVQKLYDGDEDGFRRAFPKMDNIEDLSRRIYRGGMVNYYNWNRVITSIDVLRIASGVSEFRPLAEMMGIV